MGEATSTGWRGQCPGVEETPQRPCPAWLGGSPDGWQRVTEAPFRAGKGMQGRRGRRRRGDLCPQGSRQRHVEGQAGYAGGETRLVNDTHPCLTTVDQSYGLSGPNCTRGLSQIQVKQKGWSMHEKKRAGVWQKAKQSMVIQSASLRPRQARYVRWTSEVIMLAAALGAVRSSGSPAAHPADRPRCREHRGGTSAM